MPLDPQLQSIVDAMAQNPDARPTHELEPAEAREGYRALADLFGPGAEVGKISDRRIPGPAGDIPVRVYEPAGTGPFPILVFYHGGGFVIGDLDTHDKECRALCNGGACLVVAVDYRLAPEHRFPAAVEDAVAALEWVAAEGASLGGDPSRLAVGGDSAGGNLSAVVAQHARNRRGPALRFQLLVYPTVQLDCAGERFASRKENAAGPFLMHETINYFMGHYIGDADEQALMADPRISPIRADSFEGLPPALVVTAELDPLRDEGEAYARALEKAGVPVTLRRYDGMAHVFFQLSPAIGAATSLLDEAGEALRRAFA
ncbi:MAG: alpha/beta hydrolase [Myxococcota bacterium]|nr:alpha/beta hydrolase [Myxococcota bacterium]